MPFSFLCFFSHATSRILSMASFFALSMKAQVFTMIMSAEMSSAVISYPASASSLSMTSVSIWFFGHPRDMKPIFGFLINIFLSVSGKTIHHKL